MVGVRGFEPPASMFNGLLPIAPRMGSLNATLPRPTLTASGHTLPLSIDAAHAELDAMHRRLAACTQALARAEETLRAVTPKAEKWDAWNHKKRRPRIR